MAVVIALDAGTTGVRAFAVDEAGPPAGYRYQEFTQHFPRPGLGRARRRRDLVGDGRGHQPSSSPSCDQPVAAFGITDQRETIVAWDRRTGRPRHRAIVWQDRRTAARCDELRDAGPPRPRARRTGLVLDPYFSATKVEWLLTEGGVARPMPTCALGTIDTWLLWNLTGGEVHATEPSNASRTMLYDIRDAGLVRRSCATCSACPVAALPEVRPSSGRFGVTDGGHRACRPACRSAASPATSRRRCSARPASSPA